MRAVAAAFAHASGNKVTVVEERGAALERRIQQGPADVITGNPERIAELIKSGKVVAGTGVPFAMASLGVSVRAGAPKPDISTVEAYKAALLAAKSIRLFVRMQRDACCGEIMQAWPDRGAES